jgi:hypothetical protein
MWLDVTKQLKPLYASQGCEKVRYEPGVSVVGTMIPWCNRTLNTKSYKLSVIYKYI